jgi:hypothetical protein
MPGLTKVSASARSTTTFTFGSRGAAGRAFFALLHTAEAPDNATWRAYVLALAAVIERTQRTIHIFAVTDGGGPDSSQRRELAEVFARDRHGSMTQVFTTSAFTRGMVTARGCRSRSSMAPLWSSEGGIDDAYHVECGSSAGRLPGSG